MTTKHTLTIENLKCGGCTATIISRVGALDSVEFVEVDLDADTVSFYAPPAAVGTVRKTLRTLGYPERDSTSGISNIAASARSYVSCAIGKVAAS